MTAEQITTALTTGGSFVLAILAVLRPGFKLSAQDSTIIASAAVVAGNALAAVFVHSSHKVKVAVAQAQVAGAYRLSRSNPPNS